MRDSNWFKGESSEHYSGSIVVSFSTAWQKRNNLQAASLVFRKRVPTTFSVRKMYLYIGSPHSRIVGFASVTSIDKYTLSEALAARGRANISELDLVQYFGRSETIGGYNIGLITEFSEPLLLPYLKREAGFVPPQSFVRVSKEAEKWLMQHKTSSRNG